MIDLVVLLVQHNLNFRYNTIDSIRPNLLLDIPYESVNQTENSMGFVRKKLLTKGMTITL